MKVDTDQIIIRPHSGINYGFNVTVAGPVITSVLILQTTNGEWAGLGTVDKDVVFVMQLFPNSIMKDKFDFGGWVGYLLDMSDADIVWLKMRCSG